MFMYDKKLQYPIRVSGKDPKMAKNIIIQYGGADGEFSASMNYLTQRFSMPLKETQGLLTDIGISCSKCSTSEVFFFTRVSWQISKNIRPFIRQQIQVNINVITAMDNDSIHNTSIKGIVLFFSKH